MEVAADCSEMAPRLASARLTLRPIEANDAAAIAALHADPRVARLLVDGIPDTVDKAAIFLAWNAPLAARGIGTFAVRRHGDPRLAGLFSLTPFDDDDALLELGGKLAPGFWGSGVALEAAALLIEHAFGTLDRPRLISAFDPGNRSARVALGRLGFAGSAAGTLFGRAVETMNLSREAWRHRHSMGEAA